MLIPFTFRNKTVPENGPLTLNRKRIFIIPNRLGMAYVLVVATMLFGSINYDNSLGYALSFLLCGLFIISVLHTYHNLAHLKIDCGGSSTTFAGTPVNYFIKLTSNSKQRFNITVNNQYSSEQIDLSLQDTAQIRLGLPTNKRGFLNIGKLRLSTTYPLGIIEAWAWIELNLSALIYPSPEAKNQAVEMTHSDKSSIATNDLEQSDDFAGFRNYQIGDSPKHLFWKYFSANDTLLTKQFVGGGKDEVWLNWQSVAHLPLEQALSRLCQWVLDCEKSSRKYGLKLPNKTIKPSSGDPHKHKCLRQLALFK